MSTAKAKTGGSRFSHVRDRLTEELAPVIATAGFDLEELSVSSAGQRRLIRAVIDADGGVDLDAVATVSERISAALDEPELAHLLTDSYVLEVTSPGTDRPLTEQRHWRRAIGRLVKVEVASTSLTGRILDATSEGVTMEIDGASRIVGWTELSPGRIQVEFNRPAGAGSDQFDIADDEDDSEGQE